MSRTDSTYARRWPIRWGRQLRLALVASALCVATSAALADWQTKDVPGTPNDVQVWSPGSFSVTTSQGAYLFRPDAGVPLEVLSTQAVGARLRSSGCFEVFLKNDSVTSSPNRCATGVVFGSSYDLNRVRTSEPGAAYVLGKQQTQQLVGMAYSPSDTAPWGPSPKPQFPGVPMALGTLRQGSAEHALFAVGGKPDCADLFWYVDGVQQATYAITDSSPAPKDIQAIDLFSAGSTNPTALFGWVGKLYRVDLVSSSQPSFTQVPLPLDPVTVTGVAVNTGSGSANGDGFGMATVQYDGGVALLSAVPAAQPQDIGLQWRVNPTMPTLAAAPRYLACEGAQFCVMAQNGPPPGNLLVYINSLPPTITVDPNTTVPEGTMRTLAIRASDPDGDAVGVKVMPDTISDPALSMTSKDADGGGGVDLALSGGAVCADASFPVTVTAKDGLAAHDQTLTLLLQVIHTRQAGPPGITPSANIIVQSGTQPAAILVTPAPNPPSPAPPDCAIVDYRWTALTPLAPPLMTNGASAVFPTPDSFCQRDGASYVYRVEGLDGSGLASEPRDFTIQLKPWGKPFTPFNTDPQVNLAAGAGARLTPDNTHPCAKAGGFPGVDTLWELTDGKPLPPGIRLRAQDGTLVTGLSAVTPELQVETDECAAGDVTLSVKHLTRDGSGIESPSSTVHLHVDPQWVPISNAVLKLDADEISSERIAGTASVEGLNCIAQRGGVKARMRLWRDDGTLAQQKEFRVPGPWEFAIDPVCQGQHYRIEADLMEGPGFAAQKLPIRLRDSSSKVSLAALLQLDITVPPIEVTLKPSDTAHMVAQCGQAASGTLEQRLPAGPCSGTPVTWEYVSGPELAQSTFTGEQIDITTKETDFGALLGQSVVLRITADTGKASQIEQTVPITAEPFVTVERHVENAVGADTDLIGVSVDLHNTTECSVGQVDHMERLVGVDYVPGSARFNDTPVEAEMDAETLTVRGLTLEGSATSRLTYVVRPRLLGASSFEGQSFVRGVPVSQPPPEPPSGCGCDGGGSGFAALGLAGLAVVLRRRRER